MNSCITAGDLKAFSEKFSADRGNIIAMNTVTSNGLLASARQFTAVRQDNQEYSVNLDQHGITWQKNSGRCWMFAGFNCLRYKLIKELNLDGFEFSGNYLMFYDKIEKANYFLEAVIENISDASDSRLMERLLRGVRGDGGEWEMFVNLVNKYGIVPAYAQPEAVSTNASREMAPMIAEKLREYARDLRRDAKSGKTVEELRADKEEMLKTIYRMYCICYGEPVKTFDFQVHTKDGKFICDRNITPMEFFNKYINVNLYDYVNLVAGSTNGEPMIKYEITYTGDVIEGLPVSYVSVPLDVIKSTAIAQLQAGEPVWFGCDVGEMCWREGGILDDKLYDFEGLFNTEFTMTKAERFAYGQAHMSHAMTFKGVDLDENGKPIKWRVENTWGPDVGQKGMFVMTDGWFDKYSYQVIINRKYVPEEILKLYDGETVVKLDPWTIHR